MTDRAPPVRVPETADHLSASVREPAIASGAEAAFGLPQAGALPGRRIDDRSRLDSDVSREHRSRGQRGDGAADDGRLPGRAGDGLLRLAGAPRGITRQAAAAGRNGARQCASVSANTRYGQRPIRTPRRASSPRATTASRTKAGSAIHSTSSHQGFLLTEDWWHEATTGVRGVSRHNEAAVSFLARQLLDMVAPSNIPSLNPEVIANHH